MPPAVLEGHSLGSRSVSIREADLAQTDLEPFRRELTGYCYRMLGSGFEAEDAVQETMLRAWRKATSFEGRSSLRSWLYRIATNVCIDMQRNVQRRARPMEMGPSSPPIESNLGPLHPEATWVTPIPDAARRPGRGRSGRRRALPRVHPLGLRDGPPAPPGPPAGRPDPLRGAALAGVRGGRTPRPPACPLSTAHCSEPGARCAACRRRIGPSLSTMPTASCWPAMWTPSSATTSTAW